MGDIIDDLISTNNLIEGFITPDKRGVADFDKLTVTLTDAFDGCLVIMQKAVSKHTAAAVLGIIITVER